MYVCVCVIHSYEELILTHSEYLHKIGIYVLFMKLFMKLFVKPSPFGFTGTSTQGIRQDVPREAGPPLSGPLVRS